MASTTTTTEEDVDIAANVALVQSNMARALASCNTPHNVRLVAVSKTKPIELLQRAYHEAGIRVFGENYVQELVDKVPQLPDDTVTWHFIGTLQSNKVGLLLSPFMIGGNNNLNRLVLETVSTLKLARKLQTAIQQQQQQQQASSSSSEQQPQKLKIFVQVNTSGEESKGGVEPKDVVAFCRDILQECSETLTLQGLMTIGAPGDEACLDRLVECRDQVQEAIPELPRPLELSMGMSGDYEVAIAKGSTNIRVGSTIFGERDYSNVNKK